MAHAALDLLAGLAHIDDQQLVSLDRLGLGRGGDRDEQASSAIGRKRVADAAPHPKAHQVLAGQKAGSCPLDARYGRAPPLRRRLDDAFVDGVVDGLEFQSTHRAGFGWGVEASGFRHLSFS